MRARVRIDTTHRARIESESGGSLLKHYVSKVAPKESKASGLVGFYECLGGVY